MGHGLICELICLNHAVGMEEGWSKGVSPSLKHVRFPAGMTKSLRLMVCSGPAAYGDGLVDVLEDSKCAGDEELGYLLTSPIESGYVYNGRIVVNGAKLLRCSALPLREISKSSL